MLIIFFYLFLDIIVYGYGYGDDGDVYLKEDAFFYGYLRNG